MAINSPLSAVQNLQLEGLARKTLAAGVNNNLAVDLGGASRIILTLVADADLTGIAAPPDGGVFLLVNDSAFTLTLLVDNAGSLAPNRFMANGDVIIPAQCGALVIYDINVARWLKT